MYKINEIVQQTGLNERYVRQCVRELKDLFQVKRGVKNSILLDHSALPVFEKIKQEKENGVCFTAIKELLLNTTGWKTERDLDQTDEWLSIKDAAKLSKRSEMTIRRLVLKLKNSNNSSIVKKEEGEKGKWVIDRQFILDHFKGQNHHVYINDQYSDQLNDLHSDQYNDQSNEQIIELYKSQIVDLKKEVDDFKTQIAELKEQSEKQITELKEQLSQKDAQLEKQAIDFKDQLEKQAEDFKEQLSKKDEQLNQKDQQIHQLHVLLKESKTNTIDYKPDENLGVFSKVLVKFGL